MAQLFQARIQDLTPEICRRQAQLSKFQNLARWCLLASRQPARLRLFQETATILSPCWLNCLQLLDGDSYEVLMVSGRTLVVPATYLVAYDDTKVNWVQIFNT